MESFLSYIQSLNPFWVYAILFTAVLFEHVFPPFPGDTIIILCAYLCATGKISIEIGMPIAIVATLLGKYLLYWFGYKKGRQFFYENKIKFLRVEGVNPKGLARVERMYNKYGSWLLAFNRFLVSLRTLILIFAGIGRVNLVKFFAYSMISTVMWNGLMFYLGYQLRYNQQKIFRMVDQYAAIIAIIAGLAFIAYFIKKRYTAKSPDLDDDDSNE